jgi:hypothetical protein
MFNPIQKEIKMYTTLNQNRSFNLFIVAGIAIALLVAALAIKDVSRRTAIMPNTGGSLFTAQSVPEAGAQGVADYIRAHSSPSAQAVLDASTQGVATYLKAHSSPSTQAVPETEVQSVADYIRLHSDDLSLREVQLGERYGVLPDQVALLIAEQKIHREYILGERFGVTPQQSPRSNASLAADQTASDFYQRHPDWMWGINDQNTVIPVTGDLAFPDYFMRHPELTVPAEESVDMTDYFFRHPELHEVTTKIVDLTDYYFRHRR